MEPKFKIGDIAWIARSGNRDKQITCPDCRGTGQMTVTFADGETVSVECGECRCGYEPPTGTITQYVWESAAEAIVIDKMEIDGTKVKYNRNDAENVFATKEEAEIRAAELAAEHNAEEERRLNRLKENPEKKWAWNASYHRKCLRQAEQEIIYHTAKLNVAKLKAKETKTT